MKVPAAFVLLCLALAAPGEGSITPSFPKGAEAGYLFRAASLPPDLRPAPETLLFDVNESGRPFFLVGNALVPLYTRGDDPKLPVRPTRLDLPVTPSSFAFMRDGSMLVVAGRQLGSVTAAGFHKMADLPADDIRIAAADHNQAYLYGGDSPTQRRRLYLFRKDGKILPLFEAPAPITAVTGFGDLTFVAIGSMVLYLRFGEPLVPLFEAPAVVVAMAPASPGGLFVATPSQLHYIHDSQISWVAATGATIPQVRGDTLYLFSPDSGDVLISRPVALFAERAKAMERTRAGAQSNGVPPEARAEFEKGLRAMEKRAWRKATESFTAAQKLAPHAPPILFNLGIAYAKRGLEVPAMAWLQTYLAAAPNGREVPIVRREIARLSRIVERKVASVSRVSQRIHEDLEGAGVRPGTLRDYARLGAQVSLANGDLAAAEAAVASVADITDRDSVWVALVESMLTWPGDHEIAQKIVARIEDAALRDQTMAKVNAAPSSGTAVDALEAVRYWSAFATHVSSRAEGANLKAELRRASKLEAKVVPVQLMEIAAAYGCDYLRMRRVQSRYPVMSATQ